MKPIKDQIFFITRIQNYPIQTEGFNLLGKFLENSEEYKMWKNHMEELRKNNETERNSDE